MVKISSTWRSVRCKTVRFSSLVLFWSSCGGSGFPFCAIEGWTPPETYLPHQTPHKTTRNCCTSEPQSPPHTTASIAGSRLALARSLSLRPLLWLIIPFPRKRERHPELRLLQQRASAGCGARSTKKRCLACVALWQYWPPHNPPVARPLYPTTTSAVHPSVVFACSRCPSLLTLQLPRRPRLRAPPAHHIYISNLQQQMQIL